VGLFASREGKGREFFSKVKGEVITGKIFFELPFLSVDR